MRTKIETPKAPKPLGTYSQAIQAGKTVFLAGQIPLNPITMEMVSDDFSQQVDQVFKNIQAVCEASGGHLNLITKLTIYLMDLSKFSIVNEKMQGYFSDPYPARTTIQVSALPKSAQIEIDAVMVI